MSITQTCVKMFSLDQLNLELKTLGISKTTTNPEVALAAILKIRQVTNLDSWTSLYLDLTQGKVNTKELQALLQEAGAKSPTAASNRLVMQRHPQKYQVNPKDQARPQNIPASTRGGRVTTITSISLNKGQAQELEDLLTK